MHLRARLWTAGSLHSSLLPSYQRLNTAPSGVVSAGCPALLSTDERRSSRIVPEERSISAVLWMLYGNQAILQKTDTYCDGWRFTDLNNFSSRSGSVGE